MAGSDLFEIAPFVEKASRLELIIRWLYGIIIGLVFWAWGLYASVLEFLQFWHILIFGRRGTRLYRSTRRFLAASTYASAYLMFLTDERPELTPDFLIFFKKAIFETSAGGSSGRYCVSCGAKIATGAKFCGTCGASQP